MFKNPRILWAFGMGYIRKDTLSWRLDHMASRGLA